MAIENKALEFFNSERPKIIRFLTARYNLSDQEAEDCFQEGCVAVWNNIQTGKLTEDNLTCSLSTYLTRCCINHTTHLLSKKTHQSSFETHDFQINEDGEVVGSSEAEELSEDQEYLLRMLETIVQSLPKPCDDVLWGTYRNGLSNQELAEMLGYRSDRVVITTRSRCMKKLKERMYSLVNH